MDGRSEAEIKLDIVRAMDREEPPRVISAAKVLGVDTEGISLVEVKMRVIRSIAI